MFNPFVWFQNYRLERLRLKIEAANKPFDSLIKIVEQMSNANTAHAEVMKQWLSGFTSTEIPKTSVIRDEDEYREEQNREYSAESVELNPAIQQSITNALKAGAFPDLANLIK